MFICKTINSAQISLKQISPQFVLLEPRNTKKDIYQSRIKS